MLLFFISSYNDKYCIFVFIDLTDNLVFELSMSVCINYVLQWVGIKNVIQCL